MPSLRSRAARWSVALGAIGTVVAASLALPAAPPRAAAPPPIVDDATIELAIDGFHSYLFRNAEVDPIVEPCPMLTPEQLGWYTQQWNVIPSTQGYVIDAGLNSDLGDNVSLYCGVDLDVVAASPDPAAPFGIGLEVSYLLGSTSLESVLAADEGAVLVPAVATVGGALGGWCGSGANAVCLLRWSRNELLISMAVVGPPSGVQQQAMIDMFSAMLPEMVTNLGAAYQETSGPTTMPSLPPLPQDQPTIPPTTAATPVTTAAATVPATTVAPTVAATPTVPPAPATTAAPTVPTVAATTVGTTNAETPTVPPVPVTSVAPAPTLAVPTVPTVPTPTAPPPAPPTTAPAATDTTDTTDATDGGADSVSPIDSVATDGSDASDVESTDVESTDVESTGSMPQPGPAAGLPTGAFAEGAAKIPAGAPGEVTIVMQSSPDTSSVSFIVRNDTDAPVYDVDVSGVARGADGALAATGSAPVSPIEIPAGGWAMGELSFGFDALAGDEEIELAVTGVEADSSREPAMLTVTEATYSAGGYTDEIVGIARNDSSGEVSFPRAAVACFDGSELTGVFVGYGDVDDVAAGSTTPFSINVPSEVICTSWVVIVEG